MGTILISLSISIAGAVITFFIISTRNKRFKTFYENQLNTFQSSVTTLGEEHLKTNKLTESNKKELESIKIVIEGLSTVSSEVLEKLDKFENANKEQFIAIAENLNALKMSIEEEKTTLSNAIEQKSKILNEVYEIEKTSELKLAELNKSLAKLNKENQAIEERIKIFKVDFDEKLTQIVKTNKDKLTELKKLFEGLEEITNSNDKNIQKLEDSFTQELNQISQLNAEIKRDFYEYQKYSHTQLSQTERFFKILSRVVTVQLNNNIHDLSSKLRQAEAEMAEIQEWHFLRSQQERANQISLQNAKINSIKEELEQFYSYVRNLLPITENKQIQNVPR
jgi:hypothetical protein